MNFIRLIARWPLSHAARVAPRCIRLKRYIVVLLCVAACATRADDTVSLRAQSVANAQRAAANIESATRFLPDLMLALAGTSARIETERLLAQLYTALAADALADTYLRAMQADAKNAGDDGALGAALISRIEAALGNGNYDLCEQLNTDLLQLAQRSVNRSWLASAEEYQGVLDRRHGRIESAIEHQQTALELRQKLGDLVGQAFSLTNLGTIERDRGDFARTLDYDLQALAIRERVDSRLDIAYRNLALLYRELDDEKTTLDYFEKAIKAAERYADPGYYASVYGSYASFLNDTHHYDLALKAAAEALSLSQVLDNRPAIGFEHLESGRALLGLKRIDEANMHLEAALSIGREIDQRELIVRSELSLAEGAQARSDFDRVRSMLDSVFSRLDAARMKPQLAQAYDLRDHLAEAQHDMNAAHDYAHRYAQLREELLGVRSTRQLAAIEVRKAREQSEEQLELAARTNELQSERLERGRLERKYGIVAIVGLAWVLAIFIVVFVRLRRLNRALATRNNEIDAQHAALSRANDRLERQAEALYRAAITDPLTGVYNRAHLFDRLEAMLLDCNARQRDMSVLMIDFDNFKQVNDQHGHLVGDRILIETLQAIRAELDEESLVGRFGGEEFIIAFSGRNSRASREVAEHLRETVVRAISASMPNLNPIPTISVGIALLSQLPSIRSIDPLIDAADRAVYAAKLGGRNQVREMPGTRLDDTGMSTYRERHPAT